MQFASIAKVNCLFYISTLKANESYIIQDSIRDLKPFFEKIKLPFFHYDIDSKDDLIGLLQEIRDGATNGLLPLIHLVGHGAENAGLGIADSGEMLYWDDLCGLLKEINVACGNNLCVVASSCYSLELIEEVKITQAVPFYMLIAPEKELQFSYFLKSTLSLYEAIFTGMDMIGAHDKFTSEQMKLFHCEKMFSNVFARHILEQCRGDGRRNRIEHLVSMAMRSGRFADTQDNISMLSKVADEQIEPSEELLNRYASTFLIGKKTAFTLREILDLVDGSNSKTISNV